MNKNLKIIFLFTTLLITSCKTKEKNSQLNYMQNIEDSMVNLSMKNAVLSLQKGDQLSIYVTAKDMTVVKPFNQNYTTVENSQYSLPNSNISSAQASDKNVFPSYTIDNNGEIDFPILGKIKAEGKTMEQFQDELRNLISTYVVNPSIKMKITNYKITVLGEVTKPGQYVIPDGQQVTVLSALGFAGDVTMYAKRDNVLLVRNENGNVTKERINLLDANFFNSDAYQLKQNDILYISSNKTKDKIASQDPNTNIYIAVAGMIIGLAGIFITIFKN